MCLAKVVEISSTGLFYGSDKQTNTKQETNILHEVWKERNLLREIKVPTYRISLSKRLRFNKHPPMNNRSPARP